jgi:hypothetical protein
MKRREQDKDMKHIDIVSSDTVKAAHVDGNIIGFLPLTAIVYGVRRLEGMGMLYAYDYVSDVWWMITPAKISEYPAAERFVQSNGGLGYEIVG